MLRNLIIFAGVIFLFFLVGRFVIRLLLWAFGIKLSKSAGSYYYNPPAKRKEGEIFVENIRNRNTNVRPGQPGNAGARPNEDYIDYEVVK